MTVILVQAQVARGLLKRHWTGSTAIYTDQSDNVLAWFCVCESFVDRYEAPLDIRITTPMCLGLVQILETSVSYLYIRGLITSLP